MVERGWERSQVPVTLPRVRPRPSQTNVRKRDAVVLPASSENGDNGDALAQQARRICLVCNRAVAAYLCPRCRAPYCSSACYRTHGEGCTEAFYRRHVEAEMKLRCTEPDALADGKRRVASMLMRVRGGMNDDDGAPNALIGDDASDGEGGENDGSAEASIQRLAQLALSNESGALDESMLTEEERRSFARAVASGELSRFVQPWRAWWEEASGVVGVNDLDDNSANAAAAASTGTGDGSDVSDDGAPPTAAADSSDLACQAHTLRTLRTAACAARQQSFSSLGTAAPPPSPLLPNLVMDVTFAYACAMRLYNGCWCHDAAGAAQSLVAASPVLAAAAVPPTPAAALDACAATVCARPDVGGLTAAAEHTRQLRRDVCRIWADPELLLCALVDARNMLSTAAGEAKEIAGSKASVRSVDRNSDRAVSGSDGGAGVGSKDGAAGGSGSGRTTHGASVARRRKQHSRSSGGIAAAAAAAARQEAHCLRALEKRLQYFVLWAGARGKEACSAAARSLSRAVTEADEVAAETAAAPAGTMPAAARRGPLIEELS
ncbi:unnamed protein product [Phaeothamnion confervicola]